MPLYQFRCELCGPFDVWADVGEHDKPVVCPQCRSEATRIFTPPNLARMSASLREALSREAKSAHDPDVVGRVPPKRHSTVPGAKMIDRDRSGE
jgi:putative FmdB family regulatory protein